MKYAICNETFGDWDHARVCRFVADLGYKGLELAPFTLAARITDVTAERRLELRREAESCGLSILGLHWLLAKTERFHLNSADATVRQRTADYLIELAKCCRDVGGNILVFGSPAQRRIPAGATREEATRYAVDTFRRAAGGFADCGVTLAIEPLSPPEADFINTAAEAVAILDELAHPNFALHLDVKAMSTEDLPTPSLIDRHKDRLVHFHANDPNKRGPGFGKTDFVPIFKALMQSDYQGRVSVEVFDYTPDPETIARESLRYMRACEAKAEG
jgi:sugar phosphate isomerase/epimerase